jgi:hypothetical protein
MTSDAQPQAVSAAPPPTTAGLFDLLDIQRVLGHSDPTTTMHSYLEPLDTQTISRAAAYLD